MLLRTASRALQSRQNTGTSCGVMGRIFPYRVDRYWFMSSMSHYCQDTAILSYPLTSHATNLERGLPPRSHFRKANCATGLPDCRNGVERASSPDGCSVSLPRCKANCTPVDLDDLGRWKWRVQSPDIMLGSKIEEREKKKRAEYLGSSRTESSDMIPRVKPAPLWI
jgi:hypothetical protein